MSPLVALLAALAGFGLFYVVAWWRGATNRAAVPGSAPEATAGGFPSGGQLGIGVGRADELMHCEVLEFVREQAGRIRQVSWGCRVQAGK